MVKILLQKRTTPVLLAVLVTLLAVGLRTMQANSQADILVDRAGGAYQQLEVVLRAESAASPGGTVTFTFEATPLRNAPDLIISWELPEGGTLLGGSSSESMGAVAVGESVRQTRQVQFPGEGIYSVRARATYQPNDAMTMSALAVLFFTVRADGSSVSDVDPRILPYEPPRARFTIDKSDKVVAAGTLGPNIPTGCFSVVGRLMREDRQPVASPPGYNNITGQANSIPVHHILVEMREEDTISDDSYGHTVTDANGFFTFIFCDDDGVLDDELELYYRVCSEVWDGSLIARIEQIDEDELYCWDSGIIESEGGDINFGTAYYTLTQIQSPIFNIAEALYWASTFWNQNLGQGAPRADRSVTVKWQVGKRQNVSYYDDTRTIMVIADDASSTDEWDESVIMHEWGHFTDHQFSCNQNPGGKHFLPGLNVKPRGDQLAWGEGYADYFQSAARTIMPGAGPADFYIDPGGPTVNLEAMASVTADPRDEGAIASLLWDFFDAANDGSDTVNHGHARIQRVFTAPGFQGNMQCNMRRFLRVWRDLGMPTDAATAATVVQNVNIANPFALSVAAADSQPLLTAAGVEEIAAVRAAPPLDYRWWDQVTMVVDNSTSMGTPAGTTKLDAAKALIREQVNDYSKNKLGTEFNIYAFNASGLVSPPVVAGRFFAEQIDPALNGLVANGADNGCPVDALYRLTQATENKYDGHAWVYTDGDAVLSPSPSYIQQQLNARLLHGSVVLLGGCGSPPTRQSDVTGAEKNYLGLAADGSQSGGIVPYLLTAIGTGGQFLFVAPDQLPNAVDILRAQLSHSAGAGRWSDYVSDTFTYRWDRLLSWEYQWVPTIHPNIKREGQISPNNDFPRRVTLPDSVSFSFFGYDITEVDVYQDGYMEIGPCDENPNFPFCPLTFHYARILNKELEWGLIDNPNLTAAEANEEGPQVWAYSGLIGDWFVITTAGDGLYENGQVALRAYQAWFNVKTGEIRYLYNAVRPEDTAGAVIGVSEESFLVGNNEVIVSNQDLSGAASGTGYKFTPAPPQPTKTYTTEVDSQIQAIGFLLTGYSGSLAPMAITYPDGTAVDCNDSANVTCLSLNEGLVQYVQVNINGRVGIYTTVVSAGATGQATFSFTAMAASPIQATALGKRTLGVESQSFLLDLGRTVDGGVLAGWLQTATGARFGSGFTLFDDGAHGDELAGDGIFGSDSFLPPGQGVAYLWVQGAIDGEKFTRNDPTPFNFQPIKVEPDPPILHILGNTASVGYAVTNLDAFRHCFFWEVTVPSGWTHLSTAVNPVCLDPGQTGKTNATFSYALGDQSGGVTSQFHATFREGEEARIVGGATATVSLYRPLAGLEFDNRWIDTYLRPNNRDTVSMTINLIDDQGRISGWTGLLGLGDVTVTPPELGTATVPTGGFFDGGRMPVLFQSAGQTGEALITVVVEGSPVTTTLRIRNPTASSLDLVATPRDLSGEEDTQSTLVATLRDAWGDPVVGQMVRLSVSGDDGDDPLLENEGAINGGEVFTGTTNANGQVTATFVKGAKADGEVAIRAESLVPAGAGLRVTHEDVEIISFVAIPENVIYLPSVSD